MMKKVVSKKNRLKTRDNNYGLCNTKHSKMFKTAIRAFMPQSRH